MSAPASRSQHPSAAFRNHDTSGQCQVQPSPSLQPTEFDSKETQDPYAQQVADDAPMTPVVYLVLWTSIAVGVLRGYINTDTVAARVTASYTRTFSGKSEAAILSEMSPYCATGVDGLPGLSWYETLIELLPLLAPLFGAGFVKNRGRRMGVMLGCVLAIIGQVILAAAVHVVMLYVGGAFSRSASDILYLSSGLQIIEIAPRHSRGVFLMGHMLGVAFGTLLSAVLGFFIADQAQLGWRLLFGVAVLPAAAVLVVVPWLYETPSSLIQRGDYADGWVALREVRGPFYDAYPEYQAMVAASASMPHRFHMFWSLVTNPIHRPAIVTTGIMATTSALLNPLTMTYVSYTAFRLGGYRMNWAVFLSSFITATAYALGVIIAALLVDRAGRLMLLRLGSVLAIATLVVLVAVNLTHGSGEDEGAAGMLRWAWTQLAVLAMLSAVNGIAWSSAAWVVIMESQALVVRPAGVALCIALSGLGQSLIETKLLCKLNFYYYVVLLVLSVVCLGLTWRWCILPAVYVNALQLISMFCVPETARVPLDHVTSLWLHQRFWSKLVHVQANAIPAAQQSQGGFGDSHGGSTAVAAAMAATAGVWQHASPGLTVRPAGRWERQQSDPTQLDQLATELQGNHNGR